MHSSFVAWLIVFGCVEAAYCAIIPPLLDHARAIWAILDVALLNLSHWFHSLEKELNSRSVQFSLTLSYLGTLPTLYKSKPPEAAAVKRERRRIGHRWPASSQ